MSKEKIFSFIKSTTAYGLILGSIQPIMEMFDNEQPIDVLLKLCLLWVCYLLFILGLNRLLKVKPSKKEKGQFFGLFIALVSLTGCQRQCTITSLENKITIVDIDNNQYVDEYTFSRKAGEISIDLKKRYGDTSITDQNIKYSITENSDSSYTRTRIDRKGKSHFVNHFLLQKDTCVGLPGKAYSMRLDNYLYCFVGEVDTTIDGVKYEGLRKFERHFYGEHFVITILYDTNFIPVLETYKAGMGPNYIKKRVLN